MKFKYLIVAITVLLVTTSVNGAQPQITFTDEAEQSLHQTFLNAQRNEMIMLLGLSFMNRDTNVSQERVDSAVELFHATQKRNQMLFDSLVSNNPGRVVSAIIINSQSRTWGLEKTEAKFAILTPEVKKSEQGEELQNTISLMRSLQFGVSAPDFALTARDGEIVRLSDYEGKYLLLYFWGSWCAPCRRGHPHLVNLYNRYKDKNFAILGLAHERGTSEEAWLRAIEDGGLKWTQVNLTANETGQDVLRAYDVTAFPTKILIAPNGTIIATYIGTNTAEMDEKLKTIFGK
ncbi:MAG: redoxin domain-containing protein [Bacteroidales bacterium]|nr:redoxin domain-containing protein [Bacteroidales bacterium]